MFGHCFASAFAHCTVGSYRGECPVSQSVGGPFLDHFFGYANLFFSRPTTKETRGTSPTLGASTGWVNDKLFWRGLRGLGFMIFKNMWFYENFDLNLRGIGKYQCYQCNSDTVTLRGVWPMQNLEFWLFSRKANLTAKATSWTSLPGSTRWVDNYSIDNWALGPAYLRILANCAKYVIWSFGRIWTKWRYFGHNFFFITNQSAEWAWAHFLGNFVLYLLLSTFKALGPSWICPPFF